ncbi:hypothetical protein C8F04DRAFT_1135028 [Mycena alexandri]|uniref:Uncharacterized protein n=1 Tax=Mycena alexandri TaxID=1745969 RepID=A0AAD6WS24_9AGAR|nr:hypothetical protein C8F04DRAFT_1135028 [Mycena alexandri]
MSASSNFPSGSRKRPANSDLPGPPLKQRNKTQTSQALDPVGGTSNLVAWTQCACILLIVNIFQTKMFLSAHIILLTFKKTGTLRHMLATCLSSAHLSPSALSTVAREHNVVSRPQQQSALDMQAPSCAWSCLVRSADTQAAEQIDIPGVLLPPNRLMLSGERTVRSPTRKHQRETASRRIAQVVETSRTGPKCNLMNS